MHDISDGGARPRMIGAIAAEPTALASRVVRLLRREGIPIIVFIHEGAKVLAHGAACADAIEPEAIVGTYQPDARPQDIANDLQACLAARLRA